jgi:hypothetical protein
MPVSDGSGNCCSCGQYSNCSCGGIACSIACRAKAGFAELCGFEAFTSPSTPPKKYRRRTVTGDMSFSRYGDDQCGGLISLPASAECQSKGGTASLIGISEYTSPSTPPKKYRREEVSGTLDNCAYTSAPCSTPNGFQGQTKNVFTGARQYDPITGALTNTQSYAFWSANADGTATCSNALFRTNNPITWPIAGNPDLSVRTTRSQTQTSDEFTGDGICTFETGAISHKRTGSARADLSDEDTEDDAIARALAAIGSWTGGGTCADHTSYAEERTSGFSLAFRTSQTRVVISSGLTAGVSYEARIKIEKRVYGSGGAYSAASGEDIVVPFTASGTSHTTGWQDLPQDVGWEYRVASIEVYGTLISLTEDSWDVVDEYTADTCALTSDEGTSERLVDGSPTSGPFDQAPASVYGGGVDVETTATERTITGKDQCLSDGAGEFLQHNGTVTETLNAEDTEDDAEARAAAGESWDGTGADCSVRTAFRSQRTTGFTFGYRKTQVKVQWTAVIGQSYNVKVRFARRVLGSSGPFLFYALDERTITADAVSESTDWIDIPNEAGWETLAANCTVTLV